MLQRRVLGTEVPITVRPASLLEEMDLAASRTRADKECGRALSDTEFASYLMYPKVFKAFTEAQRKFGAVSALSTPIYFYGMQPGEEANITIEQGKTLVVQLTAIGDIEDDGTVRVFFELNGQPRVITVTDRTSSGSRSARRMADPANEQHLAAPMPGLVTAIGKSAGELVKAGDVVMVLEAMKMETAVRAPRDGKVVEMFVRPGETIEAKQLLAVLG